MEADEALDPDISASDDEDADDDRKHTKLLDAMSRLDGRKQPRLSQRTVIASQISEFNFGGTSDESKIQLHELVGSLKDSGSHGNLKKKLRTIQRRSKVVSVPLPRHEQEQIQRSTAYEATAKDISKWDSIVHKNRAADQLQFPRHEARMEIYKNDVFVERFQPRTPLEMEVAKLLQGSENVIPKDKMLTPAEEKALKAMSLDEARERRAELQKYRALLSYKEAKAKRQKKIKSKKFHRIMRKEKLKNEKRSVEELQRTDPEAYADKLHLVEKDRVEERMSLKHRGGSKFAKRQAIFGKYDDRSRQAVQEMLKKNKELTRKDAVESDSSSDSDGGVSVESDGEGREGSKRYNPWMTSRTSRTKESIAKPTAIINKEALSEPSEADSVLESRNLDVKSDDDNVDKTDENDIEDIFSVLHETKKPIKKLKDKAQMGKNTKRKMTVTTKQHAPSSELETAKHVQEESIISEKLHRKRTMEDLSDDSSSEDEEQAMTTRKKSTLRVSEREPRIPEPEVFVDPKKLFTLDKKMKKTCTPAVVIDEDDQRLTIAQAFADDDVIEEFGREKAAISERDKPKDISLLLPGWGSWGGSGIKPSKKKQERFLVKAVDGLPRRDINLGNVIISELKDNAIAKHQVSELPFPYMDVQQFNSSMRTPIGKTWNPETSFKKLIKPKIVTKMGTIIRPMDQGEMFKKKKIHPTDESSGKPGRKRKFSAKHETIIVKT